MEKSYLVYNFLGHCENLHVEVLKGGDLHCRF